jgi:hypothetical protein
VGGEEGGGGVGAVETRRPDLRWWLVHHASRAHPWTTSVQPGQPSSDPTSLLPPSPSHFAAPYNEDSAAAGRTSGVPLVRVHPNHRTQHLHSSISQSPRRIHNASRDRRRDRRLLRICSDRSCPRHRCTSRGSRYPSAADGHESGMESILQE